MAGNNRWILHFKELSLPKPLEVRFLCSSDEAKGWVPYIGKKTHFKGRVSESLLAGYGGPRMFSGGSPLDFRIVFDVVDPHPLKPNKVISVSRTQLTGQRTIADQVSLTALSVSVRDVTPIATQVAKSDHSE